VKRPHLKLLILLAIALTVRVAWGVMLPSEPHSLSLLPDQLEYHSIAHNVLAGEGFHFRDERFDGNVYAFRMPGYPLFVAVCGGNVIVVRIVQAVIDTSTALAIYLLARTWLQQRNALLAAALVAINPYLIYFSGLLLSETLFIAMLAWGMFLLAGSHIRRVFPFIGLLILALSVHIRPSAILLSVVLPLIFRRSWMQSLAGAALVFAVLLPWAIRNKIVLGEWIWTTTNTGVTLYDGFHPMATGASDQSFLATLPQLKDMSETARSRHLTDLARVQIASDIRHALRLTFSKVVRTWSPIPLSQQYGSRPLYVIIGGAYAIILFALVVWSIIASDLPKTAKLYLLAPAMYLTMVHAMSVGSLRYRIPAEPPMAVLAAGAFNILNRKTADCPMPTAD